MTYQELVDRSIAKMGHPRKYGKDKIKGYEQHHIVPVCMNGSDDGENIVYFTYAEHLMAHILLFRENPNNSKLACAAFQMSNEVGVESLLNIVDNEDAFNDCVADIVKARALWVESISGENSVFYGVPKTEECKQKIGYANKGRFAGDKNYFHTHIFSGDKNGMYGRHHTDEAKMKVSIKNKGRLVGSKHPFARQVICLETMCVYETIKEAANATGCCASSINRCCLGEYKTANGLHWMYYDEYLANEKIDNQQVSPE